MPQGCLLKAARKAWPHSYMLYVTYGKCRHPALFKQEPGVIYSPFPSRGFSAPRISQALCCVLVVVPTLQAACTLENRLLLATEGRKVILAQWWGSGDSQAAVPVFLAPAGNEISFLSVSPVSNCHDNPWICVVLSWFE